MSYFEEEPFEWEPSEADEILEETKKKLLAIAKNSLAAEVKQLKEKIEYLESENKALKDREKDIAIKEREYEYKEKNMRKVVEDEFYKKTLEDILTEKAEQVDLWYTAWVGHAGPKCNLCNDKRELIFEWPDGSGIAKKPCSCAKQTYWYEPDVAHLLTLTVTKKNSKYANERQFILSEKYRKSEYYSESSEESNIEVAHVFEKFDEKVIEEFKNIAFGKRICFTNKEACQQFCDWRNKREGYPKES